MRVVVADSSPLNYLTLIGSVEVLRQLYDTVVVPEQVIRELMDPAAPHEVRVWASTPPEWVSVRAVVVPETAMLHLDPGERAAIALAESEPDSLLLIDDAAGRLEATRRGILSTGTVGVLRAAALRGFVDLPAVVARLLATNFRVSPQLVADLLADDARRRGRTRP